MIILITSMPGTFMSVESCYRKWNLYGCKNIQSSIKASIRCALSVHTASSLVLLSVLNSGLGFIFAFTLGLTSILISRPFINNRHFLASSVTVVLSPLSVFFILDLYVLESNMSLRFLVFNWFEDFIYRDSSLFYLLLLVYMPNLALSVYSI